MKISCICPTFNRVAARPHLLNEAVESFLRQDYADKELVIINDHPGQKIVFDHSQVIVINHHRRFATLGEKYNFAIREVATGEAICTWEDDDLALPHRLSYSAKKLEGYGYYKPSGYWYIDGDNQLHDEHPIGYCHNASLYTREAFEAVGGYPLVSGPQDAQMNALLLCLGNTAPNEMEKKDWFYIYRWGVSDCHLSAFGSKTQQAYEDYAKRATQSGTFQLRPGWRMNYEAMISNFLSPRGRG
jgi:glycosyltransferase involved in cell wall biosynthesis